MDPSEDKAGKDSSYVLMDQWLIFQKDLWSIRLKGYK